MPSPTEIVTEFLKAWGSTSEDFKSAIRANFTSQTIWDNVGIAKTQGIDEAIEFFEKFAAKAGFATFTVKSMTIAAAGDTVLTERVDSAVMPNGKTAPGPGLRVMGSFEIKNGKIVAWRDYADLAALKEH